MRRLAVAVALGLVLAAGSAHAGTAPTSPVYDSKGRIVQTPLAPPQQPQRLTEQKAVAILLAVPNVHSWLQRYPKKGIDTSAEYSDQYRDWTVSVTSPLAGEIAKGRVDDQTGGVTEAWTGPQVAWGMARGSP